MEFYLIKDGNLEMRARVGAAVVGPESSKRLTRESKPIKIKLEYVVPPVSGDEGATKTRITDYCRYLASSLVEDESTLKNNLTSSPINALLQVRLTLVPFNEGKQGATVDIFDGDQDVEGDDESIFTRLKNVYGAENVKVNLSVSAFNSSREEDPRMPDPDLNFEAKDLELKRISDCDGISHQIEFPRRLDNDAGPWMLGKTFSGKITVRLSFSHDAVSAMFLNNFLDRQLNSQNKRALEKAICSDLVIVAANGAEVKCHKVYLATASDVFKAMFESEMREATTNSVEMPDMSEAGVRAFLAFIYHWDLKEASKSCDVAFELFQAGHKYNISDLEEAMETLMLAKPSEWFGVDMAVRLFIFARNLMEEEDEDEEDEYDADDVDNVGQNDEEDEKDLLKASDLVKKSVHVLKWYNQTCYIKIRDSEEYRELFEKDPKAAMALTTYFLRIP